MSNKILIIEDDLAIVRLMKIALSTNGYEPIVANTGINGIASFLKESPDLVLLDMGLPDVDGSEVLQQIREISNTPIIIVSAREQEKEKVKALDRGANDYVTKPFGIDELLARIRVALRSRQVEQTPNDFKLGFLTVDFLKRKVMVENEEVHLTPIEFKLLKLLIDNRGKVLTHAYIQNEIWGYESDDDYQSLRVFMATLRRKIQKDAKYPNIILTEVGVGYRMVDEL